MAGTAIAGRRIHRQLFVEELEPRIAPARIFVDANVVGGGNNGADWDNAHADLQLALAAAAANADPTDEIWVAAGTYKPTSGTDREATFQLLSDVSLYGGFAGTETSRDERDWTVNVTILSGDIGVVDDTSDNSYHVVVGADDAVFDGFTVTAGNANGGGNDNRGGGMYNYESSPTVTNCTFSQNTAGHGSGMWNDASSPTVTNCTFSQNTAEYGGGGAGGGMYNYDNSSPTVTNCTFSLNTATNYGGGMRNYNSSPTVTNCTFSQNTANYEGGGMCNGDSSPTVTNCTFSLNTAEWAGGGMYNDNSSPTVTNCTFSLNAAGCGGGMYNEYYSSPTVTNCILWDNTAPTGPEICNDSSTPIIGFSDIQGCGGSGAGWDSSLGTDGGGNIASDPLFVNSSDPDGADNKWCTADDGLQLQCGSPAKNSATASGAPASDILGVARPQLGGYDMGAYEYQDKTPPTVGTITILDTDGFTNDPTPMLSLFSSDVDSTVSHMRFALTEGGLSSATWVAYATSYDAFDMSAGGNGSKTVWVEYKDVAGNIQTTHTSDTTYYDITLPVGDLASPVNGGVIGASDLNGRGYIDVTFSDNGSGLDLSTILDSESEFSLEGSAASGVSVDGTPTLVTGTTYRYAFTGSFGTGTVIASFLAGAWKDAAGNTNVAEQESFTVAAAQSAPYAQDFSSGKPNEAAGWGYCSSIAGGRIQVVGGALRMDSGSGYALNEAILCLDLAGQSSLQFKFDHRDSYDEANAMPTGAWSGHQNGDGVAISDDGGATWSTVMSLGRDKTWTSYTIDLDQAVAIAGMSYTANFQIKFQQYDNCAWGSDGREFDNISVTVVIPPPINYSQNFSSGKPGVLDGWEYYSSAGVGRIQAVQGALRMDSSGGYALNEAILRLNLTGNSDVNLRFDHRDSTDEPNAMPTGAWSGHQNGDGIAVSNDNGATWYSILSLGRDKTWTAHVIDLDMAIASAGISYTSTFLIKFQQYDNCSWGSDGREFDNISVYVVAEPINYTQDFSGGKPGAEDGWEYYMSALAGRIQVVSGALRMDSSSSGVYSLNEAILCLNVTGSNNIELRFDHRDSKDEYHAMPTGTWSGHQNGDGLAISDDGGTTWYTIASLGRELNWTTHIIDLDAMIAAAGMDLVPNFMIKFQQYDNGAWGVDGREFDNISVRAV